MRKASNAASFDSKMGGHQKPQSRHFCTSKTWKVRSKRSTYVHPQNAGHTPESVNPAIWTRLQKFKNRIILPLKKVLNSRASFRIPIKAAGQNVALATIGWGESVSRTWGDIYRVYLLHTGSKHWRQAGTGFVKTSKEMLLATRDNTISEQAYLALHLRWRKSNWQITTSDSNLHCHSVTTNR